MCNVRRILLATTLLITLIASFWLIQRTALAQDDPPVCNKPVKVRSSLAGGRDSCGNKTALNLGLIMNGENWVFAQVPNSTEISPSVQVALRTPGKYQASSRISIRLNPGEEPARKLEFHLKSPKPVTIKAYNGVDESSGLVVDFQIYHNVGQEDLIKLDAHASRISYIEFTTEANSDCANGTQFNDLEEKCPILTGLSEPERKKLEFSAQVSNAPISNLALTGEPNSAVVSETAKVNSVICNIQIKNEGQTAVDWALVEIPLASSLDVNTSASSFVSNDHDNFSVPLNHRLYIHFGTIPANKTVQFKLNLTYKPDTIDDNDLIFIATPYVSWQNSHFINKPSTRYQIPVNHKNVLDINVINYYEFVATANNFFEPDEFVQVTVSPEDHTLSPGGWNVKADKSGNLSFKLCDKFFPFIKDSKDKNYLNDIECPHRLELTGLYTITFRSLQQTGKVKSNQIYSYVFYDNYKKDHFFLSQSIWSASSKRLTTKACYSGVVKGSFYLFNSSGSTYMSSITNELNTTLNGTSSTTKNGEETEETLSGTNSGSSIDPGSCIQFNIPMPKPLEALYIRDSTQPDVLDYRYRLKLPAPWLDGLVNP